MGANGNIITTLQPVNRCNMLKDTNYHLYFIFFIADLFYYYLSFIVELYRDELEAMF